MSFYIKPPYFSFLHCLNLTPLLSFLSRSSLPSSFSTVKASQRTPRLAGSSCRSLPQMLTSAQMPKSLLNSRELEQSCSSLTPTQVRSHSQCHLLKGSAARGAGTVQRFSVPRKDSTTIQSDRIIQFERIILEFIFIDPFVVLLNMC